MLADVIKQREEEKKRKLQEEMDKYNRLYKRDTIIYFDNLYKLGGIQTWINNLSLEYEFSVLYDRADKERLEYVESLGIECIKNVGQPIECHTLIRCMWGNPIIKAKEIILVIHGDYSNLKIDEPIPKHDKVIAVSKQAAKGWKEFAGEDAEVIYNPVSIFKETKPLIIGVFSRLSQEKGSKRYKYLISKLKEKNKPFLMFIFTDLPFQEEDKRIIFNEPVMNPSGWMEICDYIALLSDTEACPYNVLEALEMGKPLIITKLPVLEELGVNESNAKILEFDMSNLDIDDLWNIPVVKNWNKPNSKGWEKYMKKKVFREKYNMVNGNGEIIKEGLTIDDIHNMKIEKDPMAKELKVKAIKTSVKKKVGK